MYTIYALRKKYEIFPDFFVNSIIYIGMTKNLKQRLIAHKSKEFTDYIILDECETKEEAKNKEDFYIMSHDPSLNKATNKFGQHDTLENCLKKYKIKKIW